MKDNMLLEVKNLSIAFGGVEVVKKISFSIKEGEVLAVVGESGSGKSVTALQLLGLLPLKKSKVTHGTIIFRGEEITNFSQKQFRQLRGKEISMVFQEPMSALNPSMKCGKQVAEVIRQHTKLSHTEIKEKVLQLFEQVKLPDPARAYSAYPHELSGGQKQRVVIAMAIAVRPKLLIADEPTTALDAHVQAEIVILLKELQHNYKMGLLFISHDLDVVRSVADTILVMYKGTAIEHGTTHQILNSPKEDYTKALLSAKPSTQERLHRLPTIQDFNSATFSPRRIEPSERLETHEKIYSQSPLIQIDQISKVFQFSSNGKLQRLKAVDRVSLEIFEGETLGLVGESGCGKSTLGNLIMNLIHPSEGDIFYKGKSIYKLSKDELRKFRKEVQLIFQDPFASLNPRKRIGAVLHEVLKVHKICTSQKVAYSKIITLLKDVGLTEEAYHKFPHEFSGGQRQRVNIARAIILNPKVVVCDESVSALDISVQAQVLNLLNSLKEKYQFTYIFVSHDLAVVKYMSDRVAVMQLGKLVEKGESDQLFHQPVESYTKKLIGKINLKRLT